MKYRILTAALALALTLSACGGEPELEVKADWDVLSEKEGPIVERWNGEAAPELIAGEDYGELIPYIGGESEPNMWEHSYYYGLATRDGVIVTAPVYTGVSNITWYDQLSTHSCDTLILRSAVELPEPPAEEWMSAYDDRYGLAASDGSWYTGQIYTDLVATSEAGALLFDLDGDAVMLSPEGRELWRWEASALPLKDFAPGRTYWESAQSTGPVMRWVSSWDAEGNPDEQYVDLRDGSVYDEPTEFMAQYLDYPGYDGRSRYDEGWFTVDGSELTIMPDSGGEISVELPTEAGSDPYPDIDGDRMLLRLTDGEYLLMDFDGNVLLRSEEYLQWFYLAGGDAPRLPYSLEYGQDEEDMYLGVPTVYSRDGEELFTVTGSVEQWGDRFIIADEDSYRVTDLEGRDLLRLTRWTTSDIPANN